MKTGIEIKNALKGMGLSIVQASKDLKMNRGSLNHQLNKAKPSPIFVQKVIDFIKFKEMEEYAANALLGIGDGKGYISQVLSEGESLYVNPKDDLIISLRQTIASQQDVIDMQKLRIAQLDVQVNVTPARKSA